MAPEILTTEDRLDEAQATIELLLDLVSRYLPRNPCLLIDAATAEAVEGRTTPPLPAGSCLAHWDYSGQPCVIGWAHELLKQHGKVLV